MQQEIVHSCNWNAAIMKFIVRFHGNFVDKMAVNRVAPVEGSSGLGLLNSPKYKCVPEERAHSKSSEVSDLSKLVKFSPGVLTDSTRGPNVRSYAETKATRPSLYRSPVKMSRTRPSQKVSARVEVIKHAPCSLHSAPVGHSLSAPSRRPRGNIPSSKHHRQSTDDASIVDKEFSVSSSAERDPKKVWASLKPVQHSVSRKWEEELLYAVSSSTAMYVAEKCTAPLDRARMTKLAKETHTSVDRPGSEQRVTGHPSILCSAIKEGGQSTYPPQHVPLDSGKYSLDLYSKDPPEEVPGDNFVVEFNRALDGLQTCHGGLDSPTVMFGKDVKFAKQLQKHFPELPTQWSKGEGQGEGRRVMDTGKRYSRGHRRWTSMPEAVEVSTNITVNATQCTH